MVLVPLKVAYIKTRLQHSEKKMGIPEGGNSELYINLIWFTAKCDSAFKNKKRGFVFKTFNRQQQGARERQHPDNLPVEGNLS